MVWIYKTYSSAYHPTYFCCVSDDIMDADKQYQEFTGVNPDKPPKGITVTRSCPELPCNRGVVDIGGHLVHFRVSK